MTVPRPIPFHARPVPHDEPRPRDAASPLPTRQFHAMWKSRDQKIRESEQMASALPLFDAAHSAFARGTLINTVTGPVAIEDLRPGDRLTTADHGPMPILWIGSMTVEPDDTSRDHPVRLTRIMSDAFGMGRPMADLLVGPGARILTRPRGLRANIGSDHVLTPGHVIADGSHAFRLTPRGPVTLYHICLRRHATITANGLETESFHPGAGFEREIGPKMLTLFLGLFPHIREPHQFGPLAHLRLPLDAPDGLNVA